MFRVLTVPTRHPTPAAVPLRGAGIKDQSDGGEVGGTAGYCSRCERPSPVRPASCGSGSGRSRHRGEGLFDEGQSPEHWRKLLD